MLFFIFSSFGAYAVKEERMKCMAKRRKTIWISMMRTGILLIVAGSLLFLYKIPWLWMGECAPMLVYVEEGGVRGEEFVKKTFEEHILLYTYAGGEKYLQPVLQSDISEEEIMLAEARDEEKHVLSQEGLERENSLLREEELKEEPVKEPEEEAKEVMSQSGKTVALDMARYYDFEKLIQDFYVVDKTTYITAEELEVDKMLKQDLRLNGIQENQASEGPQVLIYHTHSQEAYADSVPGDESMTVVGAGAELAKLLESYGIRVMHHKGQYDIENRDYAYANAEEGLTKILEENPSIEVIIDLHRDGVADGTHLVTEIDGKPTAQFMFFNGLSRLKSTGEIEYLKNENRAGNLAFSFQLQVKCMEYYPGLARSIYLKGYRYNMQYREKSLLVELGAQTNTVEEVYNALPPLAHVISMVLLGE